MPGRGFLGAFVVLILIGRSLPALEIAPGVTVDWLDESVQPAWQGVPLATAFNDIAEWRANRVRPGLGLNDDAAVERLNQPVYLFLPKTCSLRSVLLALEEAHDLVFLVDEQGQLAFRDGSEHRRRHRHPTVFDLRTYGFGMGRSIADHPRLGFEVAHRPTSVFPHLGTWVADGDFGWEADDLQDLLVQVLGPVFDEEGFALSYRDPGTFVVRGTPAETALVAAELERLMQFQRATVAWRIAFGIARQPLEPTDTGVLPVVDVARVREGLQLQCVLPLTGLVDQVVAASRLREQLRPESFTTNASGHLVPRQIPLRLGQAASLQTLVGFEAVHLDARLAWVELEATGTRRLRLGVQADLAMDDATSTGSADGDRSASTTVTVGSGEPVERVAEVDVPLPVLWSWRPRIQSHLPRDHGVVLLQAHPDGQAVVTLEPLAIPASAVLAVGPQPDPHEGDDSARFSWSADASLVEVCRVLAEASGLGLVVDSSVDPALSVPIGLAVADADWRIVNAALHKAHGLHVGRRPSFHLLRRSRQSDRVFMRDYDLRLQQVSTEPIAFDRGFGATNEAFPLDGPKFTEKPDGPSSLDDRAELLEECLDTALWDVEGTGLDAWNGSLAVTQTTAGHRQVEEFLLAQERQLRRDVVVHLWQMPATVGGGAVPPVIAPEVWREWRSQARLVACHLVASGTQLGFGGGRERLAITAIEEDARALLPSFTVQREGLVVRLVVQASPSGSHVELDVRELVFGAGDISTLRHTSGVDADTVEELPLDRLEQQVVRHQGSGFVPNDGALVWSGVDGCYAATFTPVVPISASQPTTQP